MSYSISSARPHITSTVHSLPHSPIGKLTKDLLWHIFCMNADMFSPREYDIGKKIMSTRHITLKTTIITSSVCSSWRNLLLEWPSIWGRILQLGALKLMNPSFRMEIIRRTGKADLYIQGALFGAKKFCHKFFFPLLRNNWERIRKLEVRIDSLAPVEDVLYRPAPLLKVFHVHFDYLSSQPQSILKPDVLFSGKAPSLREFGIYFHRPTFSLKTELPWMNQLHSLTLAAPELDFHDVWRVIKRMPRLEYLSLDSVRDRLDLDLIQMKMKPIPLPRLAYLHLKVHFDTAMALALGIKPAEHCTLSLDVNMPFGDPVYLDKFAAVLKIYDRYIALASTRR